MTQLKWMTHRVKLAPLEGAPGRREDDQHDHLEVCLHWRENEYRAGSFTRWDDRVFYDWCERHRVPLRDCPTLRLAARPR